MAAPTYTGLQNSIMRLEAMAIRIEAIASRLEAIAIRVEARRVLGVRSCPGFAFNCSKCATGLIQ